MKQYAVVLETGWSSTTLMTGTRAECELWLRDHPEYDDDVDECVSIVPFE
jgi:hypothetical protein